MAVDAGGGRWWTTFGAKETPTHTTGTTPNTSPEKTDAATKPQKQNTTPQQNKTKQNKTKPEHTTPDMSPKSKTKFHNILGGKLATRGGGNSVFPNLAHHALRTRRAVLRGLRRSPKPRAAMAADARRSGGGGGLGEAGIGSKAKFLKHPRPEPIGFETIGGAGAQGSQSPRREEFGNRRSRNTHLSNTKSLLPETQWRQDTGISALVPPQNLP